MIYISSLTVIAKKQTKYNADFSATGRILQSYIDYFHLGENIYDWFYLKAIILVYIFLLSNLGYIDNKILLDR